MHSTSCRHLSPKDAATVMCVSRSLRTTFLDDFLWKQAGKKWISDRPVGPCDVPLASYRHALSLKCLQLGFCYWQFCGHSGLLCIKHNSPVQSWEQLSLADKDNFVNTQVLILCQSVSTRAGLSNADTENVDQNRLSQSRSCRAAVSQWEVAAMESGNKDMFLRLFTAWRIIRAFYRPYPDIFEPPRSALLLIDKPNERSILYRWKLKDKGAQLASPL